MKLYVSTGGHNLLVNASSPKEAAKLALTQWTEGGFAFGKILMVSETGFDSDNEEDLFFPTEALLEELGIEYRDTDNTT